MIEILSHIFIKDNKNYQNPAVRRGYGIICALCGIFLNLIMFIFKFSASTLTGSVASAVDAVHNLTDSASSVVTLLSFLFSGKEKTKKFPWGLGRTEYLAGFTIAVVLIFAGIKLASASITKIITPEPVTFSFLSVILLGISVLTKIYMARFNFRYGNKISSAALKASGIDCLCDSVSTLIAAFAVISANFTTLNIDAWGGLAVSAFILIAGCKAAKDSVHLILGIAPSDEMTETAERIPSLYPCVKNVHSICLHDYGAGNRILTFSAEFCDDECISSVSNVQKEIKNYILQETGCNCCLIIE